MEEMYRQLEKEFSLPDFEMMDHEFEVGAIEDEAFLLRQVREKIDEKITTITKIFEGLLHPENSFSGFREANSFSEDELEKMLGIYKKFMFYHRRVTELSIEDSDKKNSEFINDFVKEWPEMKKEVMKYIARLKEAWTEKITKKEVVGYLG